MKPTRTHPRNRAVNLFEVVLVIAVMTVFAAIAVPRLAEPTARQRVNMAAQRIASELRLASVLSRESGVARTVTFSSRQLSVTPATTAIPTLRLDQWPFSLSEVASDFGGGTSIRFDTWGRPSTGGTVDLKLGKYQRTVRVDGTTGQITIP